MFNSLLQSGYKCGNCTNTDLIIISRICVWTFFYFEVKTLKVAMSEDYFELICLILLTNWEDNYSENFSHTDLISETLNRARPEAIRRAGSALLAIASGAIQIRTFRRVRDLLLLQRANVFWSTLGCLWYALPLKRKQNVILNVSHLFSVEINIISN